MERFAKQWNDEALKAAIARAAPPGRRRAAPA
jgi:hypothetical protein